MLSFFRRSRDREGVPMLNYRDILIDGVALPRRSRVNFIGGSGEDNPDEKRSDITLPSGGSGGSQILERVGPYTTDANVAAGELALFDVVGDATATLIDGTTAGQRLGLSASGTTGTITIVGNTEGVNEVSGGAGITQVIFSWMPALGALPAAWWAESMIYVPAS